MIRSRIPKRGDVFWIDPNPTFGREMKNRHRFVVITPQEINAIGISMTIPITTGGDFMRSTGLAVVISGTDTNGVALCNQVRSFDIPARLANSTAKYIETLDAGVMGEIVARVISAIDPAP